MAAAAVPAEVDCTRILGKDYRGLCNFAYKFDNMYFACPNPIADEYKTGLCALHSIMGYASKYVCSATREIRMPREVFSNRIVDNMDAYVKNIATNFKRIMDKLGTVIQIGEKYAEQLEYMSNVYDMSKNELDQAHQVQAQLQAAVQLKDQEIAALKKLTTTRGHDVVLGDIQQKLDTCENKRSELASQLTLLYDMISDSEKHVDGRAKRMKASADEVNQRMAIFRTQLEQVRNFPIPNPSGAGSSAAQPSVINDSQAPTVDRPNIIDHTGDDGDVTMAKNTNATRVAGYEKAPPPAQTQLPTTEADFREFVKDVAKLPRFRQKKAQTDAQTNLNIKAIVDYAKRTIPDNGGNNYAHVAQILLDSNRNNTITATLNMIYTGLQ